MSKKSKQGGLSNTKVVLLAGGLGSRLSEETELKPKPMVEIGGMPILWHIMKHFSSAGLNEFIICLGYKGYVIKEYFRNYMLHTSDLTIDLESGSVVVHQKRAEPWKITLVDTGLDSMTGGRLKYLKPYLSPKEDFFMTYGDGVSNVDLKAVFDFHKKHGKLATVTAVQPPGRFGALEISNGGKVERFIEKPKGDRARINGGYFVLNPTVIDSIKDDSVIFEQDTVQKLSQKSQLMAYNHEGFWHAMDTVRDKKYLENLWVSNKAPWKTW